MVKIGDLELHPPLWSRIFIPEGTVLVVEQVCKIEPYPSTKIATYSSTLCFFNFHISFANKTKFTLQKFMKNL